MQLLFITQISTALIGFNYADFAGEELQKHEDRTDYMINIDVLKIAEGLRK